MHNEIEGEIRRYFAAHPDVARKQIAEYPRGAYSDLAREALGLPRDDAAATLARARELATQLPDEDELFQAHHMDAARALRRLLTEEER